MRVSALLATASCLAGYANAIALWPIPKSYSTGNDTVWITPDVQFFFNYAQTNGAEAKFVVGNSGRNASDNKVYSAWARTKSQLFNDNFVPWKFHAKGSTWEPSEHEGVQVSKIVVTQHTPDATDKPNYDQMNETYTLEIPSASGSHKSSSLSPGTIYINAESSLGVLHGLTTLSQLFYAHSTASDCVYSPYAPVSINDAPKYVHRGLNFDVSRQWYPKETILKTLDALSWNKFNRLHLHATDAQSWPLDIPSMPELAKKGAYRPDLIYSAGDLQDILDYAFERGIQVYIETDMPGHTTSIADAFPELIVGRNVQPGWDSVAAQPPSGSMKLKDSRVTDFVTKMLNDLQPRLFAHTNYYHTGGDEVKANIYLLEDGVKSNDTNVLTPLLQKFVDHAHEVTHANGMTPVVWEEMFGQWGLKLSKDVVIQAWQTDEIVKNITSAGYKAIGGNFDYWYLDCGNVSQSYPTFF
jgi:hexosaminidase